SIAASIGRLDVSNGQTCTRRAAHVTAIDQIQSVKLPLIAQGRRTGRVDAEGYSFANRNRRTLGLRRNGGWYHHDQRGAGAVVFSKGVGYDDRVAAIISSLDIADR